ncbi:MAG: DNA-directed RNA polymerase subunit omega [Acidobacteriota bacterium]
MPQSLEGVDSAFRYILIAARRAGQLINGARPRLSSRHSKPTTIALAEMDAGCIPWRMVSPDELEALRLEELAAREKEEQPPTLLPLPRPIVPLIIIEEPETEDEEEDLEEELEGPDFESEELGEVDETLTEDLLGEEVEA